MLFLVVRYFVMIGWLRIRGAGGRCLRLPGILLSYPPQHKCRMAALPYQAYISTRLVGLISAAPSDIDWQLSLFSSFCCFHDHREGVSFQKEAPPTSAPSMSGCANSSAALEALTEPPYWIITCSAIFASALAMWSRMNLCTACACAGVADLPVPIAHTGS